MTVVHDAYTDGGVFSAASGTKTFTHTPVGTPKGVALLLHSHQGTANPVTSVDYGGVSLTLVASAVQATGETGWVGIWFAGASIPTGAQTVTINHDAGVAGSRKPYFISVTAAANTEIGDFEFLQGNQADPQVALDTGANSSLRYSVLHHGAQTQAALTRLANITSLWGEDLGSQQSNGDRQTTAASGSFTMGYTATAQDLAFAAIAIQEVAGAPPVTGTIAVTQAAQTMAASGAEAMSGSMAATQANQTSAISGTVANPITGTMAASQADQSGAFTGSLTISGTVAATQADQTAAVSGTVANPITGTIGATQADDTGAFTGDIVSDGTLNATQANQTGAINGTVVNPITGVLDATQDDDDGAFTGISLVSITGTLAAIQGDDTAAITGDSVSPAVTGTLGAAQDDDTMVANGIAAFGVSGTISVTQDNDTMVASGEVLVAVTGVLDATQADQTMTATGSVVNPVAGAVVSVTCTISGPTLACVIGGPTATCTISPVSVIAGSNFIITATFRDAMGDLANPTTVSAVIQAPDGTQSTPTPTSSSVGVWTTVVPTDQAGFWFYQITGEGNEIDVVCHGSVCVEPALVLV